MNASLPIGLFDSGVGGLTVLKAINDLLPNENLIYLGDTARVPYGTKSRQTIILYTLMAAQKLAACNVKMIVIACNTATSAALPEVARAFAPVPVLGVVEPGAEAAARATKNGTIGVMATEATIKERAYQEAIGRRLPEATVIPAACTLLVPLAEEGWLEGEIAALILGRYLDKIFAQANPDTLLLGCTHFPLFRRELRKIAGRQIAIVDSASATARHVERALTDGAARNPATDSGWTKFLTTDNPARFAHTGSLFLGRKLTEKDVALVDLQHADQDKLHNNS